MSGRRTQKPQTAQAEEAQVEEQDTTPEQTSEEIIAALKAEQERLLAELEEAKKRGTRAPRTGPTPKQRRFLSYLAEHPDAEIAEATVAAGATATSHGFVFRLIEDGFIRVSVTERGASYVTEPEVQEESSTEEQVTEDAA